VLLAFLHSDGVLAADLLDLLGAGDDLGLVLGLELLGLGGHAHQLAFNVQAGLGLFLELHAARLELDLNLVKGRLQGGTPLKFQKNRVRYIFF